MGVIKTIQPAKTGCLKREDRQLYTKMLRSSMNEDKHKMISKAISGVRIMESSLVCGNVNIVSSAIQQSKLPTKVCCSNVQAPKKLMSSKCFECDCGGTGVSCNLL